MSATLPADVSEALMSQTTAGQELWLLDMVDTTDDEPFRYVSDDTAIIGPDGETYDPAPFDVSPPVQSGEESPRLRLNVYQVTHELVERLTAVSGTRNSIHGSVYAAQRGVMQSGSQTRHAALGEYENLEIVSVLNRIVTISFDLSSRRYYDRRLCRYHFGPGRFPGIY